MRRLLTLAILIGVLHSAAAPTWAQTDTARKLFTFGEVIELFNGIDLDGWDYFLTDENAKMEDVWSVKDGILVCQGDPRGYLSTKKEYENFKLVVEWRWPGEPGNSGVLMRVTGEPMMLPDCMEAQLANGNAGQMYGFQGFKVGGDEERLSEISIGYKLDKIAGNEKEPGEWNKYEITVDGGKITLVVNGKKVNEATGCDVRPGKIALQSEGGAIEFRNVTLTPLPTSLGPPPPSLPPSWLTQGQYSWPQFHGPKRDNISLETGLLKSWPEAGPTLLWTAKGLGHGFSSAAIANGIICTAGNIEKNTVVTALNLKGEELWSTKNGAAWTKSYPGSRSTPTIDGEFVYHQNPLGNIVCLNAKTGDIVWEEDILTKVNSKSTMWALAEHLLIEGDRLISSPGGPETCMLALNKHTGEVIWQAPSVNELAGYSAPLLVEYKDKKILVNLTAKSFIGVDFENGQLLWQVAHKTYADENVLLPIHHEGRLYVSTLLTGSVQWKIVEQDGKIGLEETWRNVELDNHHGGVLLLDGYLYGTGQRNNAKKWVCLDWMTGEKKYAIPGVGKGSLTYADGMFYTLSIDRLMGLVKPSSENFDLISSLRFPRGARD